MATLNFLKGIVCNCFTKKSVSNLTLIANEACAHFNIVFEAIVLRKQNLSMRLKIKL
jgi:hypothetical protein